MTSSTGWLLEVKVADLPYPIAAPVQRMRRAVSRQRPEQALQLAFESVEATLRYLNARLLAEMIPSAVPLEGPAVTLLGKRASLGDRLQLLGALSRRADGELAVQIRNNWSRGHAVAEQLGRVVSLRNRAVHGQSPDSAEAMRLLTVISEHASCLDPTVAALGRESLVSVFTSSLTVPDEHTGLRWMGPTAAFEERVIRLSFHQVSPGACFVLPQDGPVVALGASVLARDEPLEEDPDLWVLERADLAAAGGRAVTWHNVQNGREDAVAGADTTALIEMLSNSASGGSRSSKKRDSGHLGRHYFGTTPTMLNRLLASYVDRPEVTSKLRELFEERVSAAVWITAAPGSGKSSVMSALVRDHRAIHHFVTTSEGRDNYAAILRSLIVQLAERLALDVEPVHDEEGLPQQLANLLMQSVVNSTSLATVVVVDAVDEMGSQTAVERLLRAFPSELPDRVFLVVSSRPMLPAIPLPRPSEVYELQPVDAGVVDLLASRHGLTLSASAREQAFVASGGNPLFALWALMLLSENPHAELDFSRNLDDFFGPRLGAALNGEAGEDVELLLTTLVAARLPLDVPTLSQAAGLPRRAVLQAISRVSTMLSITDGKVSLAHKLVLDYLTDPRNVFGLEAAAVVEAHGRLAQISGASNAYPLGQRAYHLVAGQRLDDLVIECRDPDVAESLPNVAVQAADSHSRQAVAIVAALLEAGTDQSTRIATEVILALAEAGHVDDAEQCVANDAAEHLPALSRGLISLQLARASDDIATSVQLSAALLTQAEHFSDPDDLATWATWEARVAFIAADGLRIQGHHAQALALYLRAEGKLVHQERTLRFATSFQIADLDYVYGRLSASRARLLELYSLVVDQGLAEARLRLLRQLGHIELAREDHQAAAAYYGEALDLALRSGRQHRVAECYVSLAEAHVSGEPAHALELSTRGYDVAVACSARVEAGKSQYVSAQALLSLGRLTEAMDVADESLHHLREVGYGSGIAHVQIVRANILLLQDYAEQALDAAHEAVRYYVREEIYPHHRAAAISAAIVAEGLLGRAGATAAIDRYSKIPNLAEVPGVTKRLGIRFGSTAM